jgi:membrane-associated phospholipid phosphatase
VTRPAVGVVVAAAGVVAGSYVAVRTGAAVHIDDPAHRLLTDRHGPVADRVVGAFTDMGSIYAMAGVAVALATRGRRAAAADLAVAGTGAWVAAQGAKPLLHRPRPYESEAAARVVAVPAGSSWPSGHAALAAAMTDALWPRARPRTRLVLALVTGAVGLSRCYVGVHHFTDILAGVGVGILSSRTGRWARNRTGRWARDRSGRWARDLA